MTTTLKVTKKVDFAQRHRARRAKPPAEPAPARPADEGRVPRVARLMALAIRFDELLRDGIVANQAEIARLSHVTRARVTQIMNLLHLAPDIQEEILHLPRTVKGRDPVREVHVRPITAVPDWQSQRRIWRGVFAGPAFHLPRQVGRIHVSSLAESLCR